MSGSDDAIVMGGWKDDGLCDERSWMHDKNGDNDGDDDDAAVEVLCTSD